MNYTAGILMIGEQSASLYENGLQVAVMLEAAGYQIAMMDACSGKQKALEEKLTDCIDRLGLDLMITMGGVSLKPEDVVPEATEAVCQRMIAGIGECMRSRCYSITPRAILSRGEAGIRNKSIIVNLPGRAQPARENLEPVLPALEHALAMLR